MGHLFLKDSYVFLETDQGVCIFHCYSCAWKRQKVRCQKIFNRKGMEETESKISDTIFKRKDISIISVRHFQPGQKWRERRRRDGQTDKETDEILPFP